MGVAGSAVSIGLGGEVAVEALLSVARMGVVCVEGTGVDTWQAVARKIRIKITIPRARIDLYTYPMELPSTQIIYTLNRRNL